MAISANPAAFRERALARLRGEVVPTGPVHDDATALGRKRNRNTTRNAQRRKAITPWQWKRALAAFDHRCAYCGAEGVKLEREHFLSLKLGGTLEAGNVVCSCLKCNRAKRDTFALTWLCDVGGLWWGVTRYLEISAWLATCGVVKTRSAVQPASNRRQIT